MQCEDILHKIETGVFHIKKKINHKKATKSKIWTIFSLILNEHNQIIDGFVICEKCNNLFKYNGKQTSNLLRHRCYAELNSITELKKVSSLDKEDFTNVCAQWAVEDGRPFSAVSGNGFKKLAQALINIGAKYGKCVDILDLITDPKYVRLENKRGSENYDSALVNENATTASSTSGVYGHLMYESNDHARTLESNESYSIDSITLSPTNIKQEVFIEPEDLPPTTTGPDKAIAFDNERQRIFNEEGNGKKFSSPSQKSKTYDVNGLKKFNVVQHLNTNKHRTGASQENNGTQNFNTKFPATTATSVNTFHKDLCKTFTKSNIPLKKIKNKSFQNFIAKYSLRSKYNLQSMHRKTLNNTEEKIKEPGDPLDVPAKVFVDDDEFAEPFPKIRRESSSDCYNEPPYDFEELQQKQSIKDPQDRVDTSPPLPSKEDKYERWLIKRKQTLQVEYQEMLNYEMKLKIWEREQQLKLPRSKFTKNIGK